MSVDLILHASVPTAPEPSTAGLINDGDDTTASRVFAGDHGGVLTWIIDAGQPVTASSVRILQGLSWGNPGQATTYTISASANGVDWVTISTRNPAAADETWSVPPATWRYWRLVTSGSNGSWATYINTWSLFGVVPPVPTPTTPAILAAVWDQEYGQDGLPVVGAEVKMQYVYPLSVGSGQVFRPQVQRTVTGPDGKWVLWVVATDTQNPPNGSFIVTGPRIRAYRVRPVTPTAALPTDADAYLVPSGLLAGTWVHGQKSSDINISARPATL